jgi:hypothetical protein
MAGFLSTREYAPVPSAFVEVAPNTLVGIFSYVFSFGSDPIYIRPGSVAHQDYPNIDGAEWLLYSRSIMSYRIQVSNEMHEGFSVGGASLVVELGDIEVLGVADMHEWAVFHLADGFWLQSSGSGIELPGLMARFKIQTASVTPAEAVTVKGSIIVRGL